VVACYSELYEKGHKHLVDQI